jgi:hypothetical protein
LTKLIHDTYLPFSDDLLGEHFAPVSGGGGDYLAYYQASIAAATTLAEQVAGGRPVTPSMRRRGRQMEKDERFWIASALLAAWYSDDRVEGFGRLLRRCFGEVPPIGGSLSDSPAITWKQLLSGDLHLYFEVSLPSPPAYKAALRKRLDEAIVVRYVREAAEQTTRPLENSTRVDAVLVNPDSGFAVLFEAKVLADISTGVLNDVLRNQLARTVDVMLEPNPKLSSALSKRDPDRSLLVLITPKVFKDHPTSRLYGELMHAYRDSPQTLIEHLPHRPTAQLAPIRDRLGWLTWEGIDEEIPRACPWLHQPGGPPGVPSDLNDATEEPDIDVPV